MRLSAAHDLLRAALVGRARSSGGCRSCAARSGRTSATSASSRPAARGRSRCCRTAATGRVSTSSACDLIRYPERMYTDGCAVAVVHRLRNDPRALDPRAKTGNYLNNMLGMIEAREGRRRRRAVPEPGPPSHRGHDVQRLDREERQGPYAAARRGASWPASRASGSCETLPAAGVEVEEATVDHDRLLAADEVFLTGTVKGVMPVGSIDGRPVGAGRPGPVTAFRRWNATTRGVGPQLARAAGFVASFDTVSSPVGRAVVTLALLALLAVLVVLPVGTMAVQSVPRRCRRDPRRRPLPRPDPGHRRRGRHDARPR